MSEENNWYVDVKVSGAEEDVENAIKQIEFLFNNRADIPAISIDVGVMYEED